MFDSKSRKVLKVLNELYKKQGYIGSSYDVLRYCPKRFNQNKVEKVLEYLKIKEYVKYNLFANSLVDIELTHKGENYIEFAWVDFKEYMRKSIATPIIVAIITTLVTLYIKSILSL